MGFPGFECHLGRADDSAAGARSGPSADSRGRLGLGESSDVEADDDAEDEDEYRATHEHSWVASESGTRRRCVGRNRIIGGSTRARRDRSDRSERVELRENIGRARLVALAQRLVVIF